MSMGIPVMILGESGTGKSASLRNFSQDEIGVINVCGKPLPFRNQIKDLKTDNYMAIEKALKASSKKAAVIDDCQYLMANEYMRQAKVTGYQKFTDIAQNFWTLVQVVIRELPEDVIVYFLGHIERDANGNEKFKTIGKMLDEKITVEGMFTIVLKTSVQEGQYLFATRNNGSDTVKSPIGLFDESYIDNDLKTVDAAIRDYYNLKNTEG
jgi:hypothetical protein